MTLETLNNSGQVLNQSRKGQHMIAALLAIDEQCMQGFQSCISSAMVSWLVCLFACSSPRACQKSAETTQMNVKALMPLGWASMHAACVRCLDTDARTEGLAGS